MEDKFPHISDNAFPYIDNVDVYDYNIEYSPDRWGVNSVVRVLRVPWDGDYSNVIDFESDEARDAWIDSHTKEKYKLETEMIKQPAGLFRVPFTFNDAMQYNYLVVEFPKQPVQYGDEGIRRVCYFIDNVNQISPSATELTLSIDYWTTFINSTKISYMMLDRGHAPMSKAPTPSKYLADPLNNSEYILSPDVNYGTTAQRTKALDQYIANSGEMYAVFASTADVSSPDWGTYLTDNMRIPSIILEDRTGFANMYYIAVKSTDLKNFIMKTLEDIPYFFEAVQACMYIRGDLLDLHSPFNVGSVSVWKVRPQGASVKEFVKKLQPDDFAYKDEYKNITKLYTSPYAHIEVSDENGSKTTINIEEIGTGGSIGIVAAVNLIAPSASIDAHLVNISGGEVSNIDWNNTNVVRETFKISGRWFDYMTSWNIPQFAVFNDMMNYVSWKGYFDRKQARYAKDQAYASTTDSNQISYDNTARSNATANTNALASNTTAQQNTNASNATTLSNMATQNAALQFANRYQNAGAMYSLAVQSKFSKEVYDANVEMQVAGTFANAAGGLVAGAASGAMAGPVGAAVGAGTGLLGAAASGWNTANLLTNNATIYNANIKNMATMTEAFNGDTTTTTIAGVPVHSDSDGVNKIVTNNNVSANSTTTNAAVSTSNANAARSKSTSDANANRTKSTGDTNAVASKDLGDRNAARTRSTTEAGIVANQRTQELNAPQIIGSLSSTEHALTRPLGLFATLCTQSPAAISSAGDQMLRYGYTYGGSWQIDKKQVMKHFTYWQAGDIWVKCCRPYNEDVNMQIANIFKRGTTVWSDPDDIGAVSIYDNIGE